MDWRMDFLGDWLYLIIGIAVVGVLTLAGLLTGRRTKRPLEPGTRTDVIAPPPDEADIETPAETPAAPAAPAAPLHRTRLWS